MMIIFFLGGFTRWRKRINCTDCHQRLGLESLSCEQHWQLKIELRLFRFGLNMSHIKQFWSTIFKLVVASGNSGLAELQFTDVHNFNFSPGFPYVNLLRKWWELSLVNYLSFYFNIRSAFCFSVDFEANEAQAALNGQVSTKVGESPTGWPCTAYTFAAKNPNGKVGFISIFQLTFGVFVLSDNTEINFGQESIGGIG